MSKRGGDLFFRYFYSNKLQNLNQGDKYFEKKVKLSCEQGSYFVFFICTYPFPSSILSLNLFCLVLLLMPVMFSFTGSGVPQFNQFILGHGACLHHFMSWGSHCHRPRPHGDRRHRDGAPGSSPNCHPKDCYGWTPVTIIVFGSLSITWKSYLDLSPDLCTSREVSETP